MIAYEFVLALALQRVKGIGVIGAKKLIEEFGSAQNLFDAYNTSATLKQKYRLFSKKDLTYAEEELLKIDKQGLKILYYSESAYPNFLKTCLDAPLLLFYDGVKDLNCYSKVLSIVGTRNMTSYGQEFCEQLIQELKPYAPLIVSGFAYGVDICAHRAALENGLDTLGVLAHGYGTIYPKEHKRFYTDVRESAGFLSEYVMSEPPFRENFLKRNRIVAGMSQALIVVESAEKGGALVTAEIANSYNKDVFALPGRATDTYSKGCLNLIKQNKAALITSIDDITYSLGWEEVVQNPKVVQSTLFLDLEGDDQTVYEAMINVPQHIDALARSCHLPIYKVTAALFNLELKGVVKALPGKLFIKQ